MRKGLSFLVLVVSVLSFVTTAGAPEVSVEVFFVSPSVDHVIESRIIESIDNDTSQILIAMCSFTDDQLGQAVMEAYKQEVDVYILLDDGQDSEGGSTLPYWTTLELLSGLA